MINSSIFCVLITILSTDAMTDGGVANANVQVSYCLLHSVLLTMFLVLSYSGRQWFPCHKPNGARSNLGLRLRDVGFGSRSWGLRAYEG